MSATPTTSDDAQAPRVTSTRMAARSLGCVLLVMVAYPLSLGPVALLLKSAGWSGWDLIIVLAWLYAPLIWLERRFPVLTELFRWYLELWGV